MPIEPSSYKSVEQMGLASRSEETLLIPQKLLISDRLEARSEGGEKESEGCFTRCFSWIYELFAALFCRLCCKTEKRESQTEHKREETTATEPAQDLSSSNPLIRAQEVLVESRSASESTAITSPDTVLVDTGLLPMQKASLFFKKFEAEKDLSINSPRDAFIAFNQNGKMGTRIQLWILYHLVCKAQDDPSYEWVIKTYLVFAEGIADILIKELGCGPLNLEPRHFFNQLPKIFSEQLGLENLKPQKKEKPVESAKQFISEHSKKQRLTPELIPAFLNSFKAQTPMTQLCILYQLLPTKESEFFDHLNSDLAYFMHEEGYLTAPRSGSGVLFKQPLKEIITLLLPSALVELDTQSVE